jgi:hypothetical protein
MIRAEYRRARKRYRCEQSNPYDDCVNRTFSMIAPGDHYVFMVCSPDHDGLGNLGWWPLRVCVNCARSLPEASKVLPEEEPCPTI